MSRAVYLLYRAAIALFSLLPLRVNFALGRLAGTVAWLMAPPYRRLVLRNLRIAFEGEKSPRELRAMAREHFATLGANLLSSVKVAAMREEEITARVKFENLETMARELSRNEGAVMVISHIGNWELFAQLAPHLPGHRFATIYQALGNRFIDEHVKKTRARFGVVPFDRKDGFNAPIRFLREGGLVGILVDQHAGDHGVWAPLFGRLASTSPLAATLALRTGAPLVPVAIYTDGPARWRVVVSDPIRRQTDRPEQLTAQINEALEKQIRVSPTDWFWVHNRWKTPRPKFLLAGYKRGVAASDERALKPFRILIRASNWLGDAVMTVPAVRAIKRGRPDAHLTILTRSKLADFWKTVAEIDEIIAIESDDGIRAVAQKIRRDFDVAVLFPNSVRVALEAWLAGIPRRVGYRARWRGVLLSQIVPEKRRPHPLRHQVHHYLDMAKFIGASVEDEIGKTRPGPAPSTARRFALCPGAEYGAAKRWPPERFAAVAKLVRETTHCAWVLVGVEKDHEIGAQIAAALDGQCENLIGQTTLAELIERLRECQLLLTNDTGTMHLAAHLGIPTVSIFGSTEPALTGPLGKGHRVLRHHVACSPCFLRECPIDFRCMDSVSVEEAAAAVLRESQ